MKEIDNVLAESIQQSVEYVGPLAGELLTKMRKESVHEGEFFIKVLILKKSIEASIEKLMEEQRERYNDVTSEEQKDFVDFINSVVKADTIIMRYKKQ